MGKRTRRKRQSKGKGHKSPSASSAPYQDPTDASSNSNTNASNDPNASVLLQRIRHADPRTRHAALAAVASTLLDTACTKVHPKLSGVLLQAIRERVLDADLDVCQVAAGCLANYVTIAAKATVEAATSGDNKTKEMQAMTAGWTIVLVGRLQQCYGHVAVSTAQQDDTSSNNNKTNSKASQQAKQHKQWLALAVQCLRTLCVLVETNPEAVGRLTSSFDATPRQDFHQTLLEWLQHAQTATTTTTAAAAAAAAATVEEAASKPYYEQILILAARTLHSAWDDNADLLLPWKEECPDAFRRALELLQSIILPPSSSSNVASANAPLLLPVEAQLHATGAVLTALPFVTTQQAVDMTQQTILPQLVQRLSCFSWETVQSLLADYHTATQMYEREQADDALERDVIRTVEEKKEPARAIAKRQKAKKEANQMAAKSNKMVDDDESKEQRPTGEIMVQQEEDTMEEEDKNEGPQVETREALEQARRKWNDFLLPLQLSLELLANVSSSGSPADMAEDDEDMMMDDWGPEQEAQWIQEQQEEQQRRQNQSSEDEVFQNALVESALPPQLVQLFRQVYQTPSSAMDFPEQSRQELEDLQSKIMACLGNCLENISSWPLEVSWSELQQAASTATGIGKEGLVSAMVIALKTKPSLRKEWQPEHLAFWLKEVGNSEEKQQSDLSVRRDAITMLGVLCSQEPHPAEVNNQVCSALLSTLTNQSESLMVQCEVLNVLMDMYGNDEDDGCCHQSVFESLQVLGHFQRCIPTLKSKLKEQERKLKLRAQYEDGADRIELEQWKETVLNGSRFVQYKKGQL